MEGIGMIGFIAFCSLNYKRVVNNNKNAVDTGNSFAFIRDFC
jgi:hypothetical protein